MSGVEVIGILLGAFPLLISAMEDYERSAKVIRSFWKIKRTHRRDLDKIKNCQLSFTLTLKQLLLPLLRDDIVAKAEYAELLAHPGGAGWRESNVGEAMTIRLGECHDRCLELMVSMTEVMAALRQATRADDAHFQEQLAEKQAANVQQGYDLLLLKANEHLAFQAKRLKYAFTGTQREELLDELEHLNKILDELLAKNDKISAIMSQEPNRFSYTAVSSKTLGFWKHAASMYRVVQKVWNCGCRSSAGVWLQHPVGSLPSLNLLLNLCHGNRAVQVSLEEKPMAIQLRVPMRPAQADASNKRGIASSDSSYSSRIGASTPPGDKASGSSNPVEPPRSCDLLRDGLCNALLTAGSSEAVIGSIHDDENCYLVSSIKDTSLDSVASTTLRDLFEGQAMGMSRMDRYRVALTLASSHLQLHSTPWLSSNLWTAEHVQLVPSSAEQSKLGMKPLIQTPIRKSTGTSSMQKDRSFGALGIVLLELCFGQCFDNHKLWKNPAYAALKYDPLMRQTIACAWSEEVLGEAGIDYANAVSWVLRPPTNLENEKWRKEFAQNVVQHLQRCYDSMSMH